MKRVRFRKDLFGHDIQIRVFCVSTGFTQDLYEFRKYEVFDAEQPTVLFDHFYDTLIRSYDGIVYAVQSGDLVEELYTLYKGVKS